MSVEKNKQSLLQLTSSEVSNIWAAYMKNSMELKFMEYFTRTTEDQEVSQVVERMLSHSQESINDVKDILLKGNLAIPSGFTDQDIDLQAPKFFSDIFTLYFCYDLTLFSMSTFSSALSDCTRADVRIYFHINLEFYIALQKEIIELMISKGIYLRPPTIVVDNVVDFVDEINYLGGILAPSRPVNVAEIANLSRVINRAQFSKMVFVAFSKAAKSDQLKKHFSKGRDQIQKVLDSLQEILDEENIPFSSYSDYQIFANEGQPFSDRLMLFFVNLCLGIFCFSIVSEALTSCFRSDITLKFAKVMKDMLGFYSDGLKLTIKEGWLERPPQSTYNLKEDD